MRTTWTGHLLVAALLAAGCGSVEERSSAHEAVLVAGEAPTLPTCGDLAVHRGQRISVEDVAGSDLVVVYVDGVALCTGAFDVIFRGTLPGTIHYGGSAGSDPMPADGEHPGGSVESDPMPAGGKKPQPVNSDPMPADGTRPRTETVTLSRGLN
jgi:hypothetical protein